MLKNIDIISGDKSYSCEIKDNKDESIIYAKFIKILY